MPERESCNDTGVGGAIAAYELGLLDAMEARRFERHLDSCPACVESLYEGAPVVEALLREPQLYAEQIEGTTSERRAQSELISPRASKAMKPRGNIVRLRPAWAAPIFSTIAVAAVLLLMQLGAEPELASLAHVEPLPYRVIELRAGGDELRERGFTAYAAGDYIEAGLLLGESLNGVDIETSDPSSDKARLYLGVSYLLSENPEAAEAPLLAASVSTLKPISESARWYLAQCALLLDRMSEAESYLSDLAAHGLVRAEAAGEQLERLREHGDPRK